MKSRSQFDTKRPTLGIKVAIVVALLAAVVGAIYLKGQDDKTPEASGIDKSGSAAAPGPVKHLPRLVDLGAGKCIPCKMMVPILEELRKEYKGKFDVIVIDVWENRAEARRYGIRVIPTQIFYDAAGKELYRHQGFFAKDEILKKWRELGIEFD